MSLFKEMTDKKWSAIILVLGLLWLRSALDKLQGGQFVQGLPKTLAFFASKNPYPFFKDFLNGLALPHASLLGVAVEYGELYVGLSLSLVSLALLLGIKLDQRAKFLLGLGLLGGVILNLVFFLASGWTSASTFDLNLFWLAVELLGLVSLGINRRKD